MAYSNEGIPLCIRFEMLHECFSNPIPGACACNYYSLKLMRLLVKKFDVAYLCARAYVSLLTRVVCVRVCVCVCVCVQFHRWWIQECQGETAPIFVG